MADGMDVLAYEAQVRLVEEDMLQRILKLSKRNNWIVDEENLPNEVRAMAEYAITQASVQNQSVERISEEIVSITQEFVKKDPTSLGHPLVSYAKALYEALSRPGLRHEDLGEFSPDGLIIA